MIGAVNGLMNKVNKDVITELPKKANKLRDTMPGQLSKVTDKIPSPDVIKKRICETTDMDTAKKTYNQLGDQMNKAQKIIDKMGGLIDKLSAIVNKVKTLLNAILDIAKIMTKLLDSLKNVITALRAGINAVAFIPSTAVTPIPVGPILILKDKLKDADNTVKLFSNVVNGITGKVEFIIPKLSKIEEMSTSLSGLPTLPQGKLNDTKDTMDKCMKDRLVKASPPVESLEEGVEGGVDAQNQTLDSLIDKENRNQENTIKIEKFNYPGFPKTQEYTVETISSEEFKN